MPCFLLSWMFKESEKNYLSVETYTFIFVENLDLCHLEKQDPVLQPKVTSPSMHLVFVPLLIDRLPRHCFFLDSKTCSACFTKPLI